MGTVLSGGQKQRVLIARALYRAPGVLLLDEATSASRCRPAKSWSTRAIRATRVTRVIVAHRPETIRSADRVINLDEIGGRGVAHLSALPRVGLAAVGHGRRRRSVTQSEEMNVARRLRGGDRSPREGQVANSRGRRMTDDEVARWTAWDRFVEAVPECGIHAIVAVGAVPRAFRRRAFRRHAEGRRRDRRRRGGRQVDLRAGRCFYYVQEGPVLPADEATAAEVFDAVLESVERHRKAEDATISHLRIEPRWPSLPGFVRGFQPPRVARPVPRAARHAVHRPAPRRRRDPGADEAQGPLQRSRRAQARRRRGAATTRIGASSTSCGFNAARPIGKTSIAMPPSYFRAMLTELLTARPGFAVLRRVPRAATGHRAGRQLRPARDLLLRRLAGAAPAT